MTEAPPIPKADLERALKHRAQDCADLIAHPDHCYSSQNNWSEDQWRGYAAGQSNLLSDLAERFEISHSTLSLHQIVGALGERYRRRHPKTNPFQNRAIGNLANAIRDKRIRMRDDYVLASYAADFRPWRKKLRKLDSHGRHDDAVLWKELAAVKEELEAIQTFNSQCLSDKHWFDEYFRRLRINEANARAIDILETDPFV